MAELQEVCHQVTDGKHGDCQNEENSGYYFISCKDVRDGWIDYSNARQITKVDYVDTNKRTKLEPYDILITNSGTIGRMVLVPDVDVTSRTTFQKSVAIVKPKKEILVPKWLFYYLKANKDLLIAYAGGTAQKNLLLRDLRIFQLSIPTIPIQHQIASILSAYGDLIENNLRRIQILEEMAQNLYREWFVHFRFPGHENVKMVETSKGLIPEGWTWDKLGEICNLRKENYKEITHAKLPLLDLSRIPRQTLLVQEVGHPNDISTSRIVFKKYDILFGSIRPYLHKVVLAPFDGVTNTSVFVLKSLKIEHKFILPIILSSLDTIKWATQYSSGTKMPVIKWDIFSQMPIITSDIQTIQKFSEIVKPIMEIILNTAIRNNNLEITRDLLLPKLIFGDVDVSDKEIG